MGWSMSLPSRTRTAPCCLPWVQLTPATFSHSAATGLQIHTPSSLPDMAIFTMTLRNAIGRTGPDTFIVRAQPSVHRRTPSTGIPQLQPDPHSLTLQVLPACREIRFWPMTYLAERSFPRTFRILQVNGGLTISKWVTALTNYITMCFKQLTGR